MSFDPTTAYWPDMASAIDTEEEIIADDLGITLEQARKVIAIRNEQSTKRVALALGQFIGAVIDAQNPLAVIYGYAFAAGLDQLNGIHSQTEVANKLGCTRALISHYTIAARDAMSGDSKVFDITKFRKRNSSRATYAQKATSPFLQAKKAAQQRIQSK